MKRLAKEQTEEAGKTEGFSKEELDALYETIGMGALKFYLLRVDPKKKMIFDPKESIDLHGYTATFIQYAHARICSILRKEQLTKTYSNDAWNEAIYQQELTESEKTLLKTIERYDTMIQESALDFNTGAICNYIFQLAQQFNSFYDKHSISKAENEEKKNLRIMMIILTSKIISHAMGLLGIKVPEKM
jgi:arginyl-tRNA synthetase